MPCRFLVIHNHCTLYNVRCTSITFLFVLESTTILRRVEKNFFLFRIINYHELFFKICYLSTIESFVVGYKYHRVEWFMALPLTKRNFNKMTMSQEFVLRSDFLDRNGKK
jgi:hypothetical protein